MLGFYFGRHLTPPKINRLGDRIKSPAVSRCTLLQWRHLEKGGRCDCECDAGPLQATEALAQHSDGEKNSEQAFGVAERRSGTAPMKRNAAKEATKLIVTTPPVPARPSQPTVPVGSDHAANEVVTTPQAMVAPAIMTKLACVAEAPALSARAPSGITPFVSGHLRVSNSRSAVLH